MPGFQPAPPGTGQLSQRSRPSPLRRRVSSAAAGGVETASSTASSSASAQIAQAALAGAKDEDSGAALATQLAGAFFSVGVSGTGASDAANSCVNDGNTVNDAAIGTGTGSSDGGSMAGGNGGKDLVAAHRGHFVNRMSPTHEEQQQQMQYSRANQRNHPRFAPLEEQQMQMQYSRANQHNHPRFAPLEEQQQQQQYSRANQQQHPRFTRAADDVAAGANRQRHEDKHDDLLGEAELPSTTTLTGITTISTLTELPAPLPLSLPAARGTSTTHKQPPTPIGGQTRAASPRAADATVAVAVGSTTPQAMIEAPTVVSSDTREGAGAAHACGQLSPHGEAQCKAFTARFEAGKMGLVLARLDLDETEREQREEECECGVDALPPQCRRGWAVVHSVTGQARHAGVLRGDRVVGVSAASGTSVEAEAGAVAARSAADVVMFKPDTTQLEIVRAIARAPRPCDILFERGHYSDAVLATLPAENRGSGTTANGNGDADDGTAIGDADDEEHDVLLEGQEGSGRHAFCMGIYERQRQLPASHGRASRLLGVLRGGGGGGARGAGTSGADDESGAPYAECNGRPVYKLFCLADSAGRKAEASDLFLFFAAKGRKRWVIGPSQSLKTKGGAGFWRALGDARRPWDVGARWQVGMGEEAGSWMAQEHVRARQCTPEMKRAMKESARAMQKKARWHADHVCDIRFSGIPHGQQHADKMGVYEAQRVTMHDRPTYRLKGGNYRCFYSDGEWVVGTAGSMKAGVAKGWLSVTSSALAPDLVTETWQVWGEWPPVLLSAAAAAERGGDAHRAAFERMLLSEQQKGNTKQRSKDCDFGWLSMPSIRAQPNNVNREAENAIV